MSARRRRCAGLGRQVQSGALLVEALVALGLAMVAALALLQADAGARATRAAAEGQIAAVVAVRAAHEGAHPLMARDPFEFPTPGAGAPAPRATLVIHERVVAGLGTTPEERAGLHASEGAAPWSLLQRSIEAQWTPSGQRLRRWWTSALQWQAPAEVLGWLDARAATGRGMSSAGFFPDPGRDPGLRDVLGGEAAVGQGLEDDVGPRPGDAPAPRRTGPEVGPDVREGQSVAGEEGIETVQPPAAASRFGLGPARPASAARFEAALRQARGPGASGVLRPGRALQSGALRVDPAIALDASNARALQDWIARVVDVNEDGPPGALPAVDRPGEIAARPPVCDLQPVAGIDPHLAWRCLGWAGSADLFLLPRTGLPTGWVVCRFRVQEPAGTTPRLQAPAPRVHAWIGLGGSACPAQAEPA